MARLCTKCGRCHRGECPPLPAAESRANTVCVIIKRIERATKAAKDSRLVFGIAFPSAVVFALLLGAGCGTLTDIVNNLPDNPSLEEPSDPYTPTPSTPDAPPAPIPAVQIAVSWERNAAYREMNLTAAQLDEVRTRFATARARGCNTVNLYLVNLRDGSPVPSTIYEGAFGGPISKERVQRYRDIAKAAREASLCVNWWFLADDGGGIPYRFFHRRDVNAIGQAIADYARELGPEIRNGGGHLVIALESDENLTKDLVQTYAQAWKNVLPGVRIANHMTSGRYDWSRDICEIDAHFHQTEPGAGVSAFASEIRNVVAKCGKPVVACEFSLIGTDDEARTKARIALDAGCAGVHSGVPQ